MDKKRWCFYFPAKQYYAKYVGNDNRTNVIQIILESIREDGEYDGCFFEFPIVWHYNIDAWQFNIWSDAWKYKNDILYFFNLFKNQNQNMSFTEMVKFLKENNFKNITKYKEEGNDEQRNY